MVDSRATDSTGRVPLSNKASSMWETSPKENTATTVLLKLKLLGTSIPASGTKESFTGERGQRKMGAGMREPFGRKWPMDEVSGPKTVTPIPVISSKTSSKAKAHILKKTAPREKENGREAN